MSAVARTDNVHAALHRRLKVERFVDAICSASKWTGGNIRLSEVADGIEHGTVDLAKFAKTIDERAPSEETARLIARALRVLDPGRSAVAAAFAEIGRIAMYAARRERAGRILDACRGDVQQAIAVLGLGGAPDEMIRAVEIEADWREDCARVEDFE